MKRSSPETKEQARSATRSSAKRSCEPAGVRLKGDTFDEQQVDHAGGMIDLLLDSLP